MKIFNCLNNTPYRPRRVLCVSKLSSLEFLRSQNPNLNEDQILSMLQERGKDPNEIFTEHQQQITCEQNLAAILKKLDINFSITKRIADAWKFMNWADLVIPIGGDGTFLLSSKLITDNVKPVLGINPSIRSNDNNIFTLPPKYATDIESIFERLHTGKYTLLMRSRIRTVMNGEGLYRRPFHIHEKSRTQGEKRAEWVHYREVILSDPRLFYPVRNQALARTTQRKIADSLQPRQRTLPWLALNEVFIGEFLAVRPITLQIRIENQEPHQVRSSGMCVCTGTGSQFWYKSINIQSAETVRCIVEIATGIKLSNDETNELLHKYHQALIYSPEDLNMVYMIREMYHTTRCKNQKCCPDRQKCNKLTVKSCGFDAGLVIDGSISLPFNDGTIATFDIKPEYSLRSIMLT